MKALSTSDSLVICTPKESGEHIMDGCGELPVGSFVKDSRNEYVGEVAVEIKGGKGLPALVDGLKALSTSASLVRGTASASWTVAAGCTWGAS